METARTCVISAIDSRMPWTCGGAFLDPTSYPSTFAHYEASSNRMLCSQGAGWLKGLSVGAAGEPELLMMTVSLPCLALVAFLMLALSLPCNYSCQKKVSRALTKLDLKPTRQSVVLPVSATRAAGAETMHDPLLSEAQHSRADSARDFVTILASPKQTALGGFIVLFYLVAFTAYCVYLPAVELDPSSVPLVPQMRTSDYLSSYDRIPQPARLRIHAVFATCPPANATDRDDCSSYIRVTGNATQNLSCRRFWSIQGNALCALQFDTPQVRCVFSCVHKCRQASGRQRNGVAKMCLRMISCDWRLPLTRVLLGRQQWLLSSHMCMRTHCWTTRTSASSHKSLCNHNKDSTCLSRFSFARHSLLSPSTCEECTVECICP